MNNDIINTIKEYTRVFGEEFDKINLVDKNYKDLEYSFPKGGSIDFIDSIESYCLCEDAKIIKGFYKHSERTVTYSKQSEYDEGWRIEKGNFMSETFVIVPNFIFDFPSIDELRQKTKQLIIDGILEKINSNIKLSEFIIKTEKEKIDEATNIKNSLIEINKSS